MAKFFDIDLTTSSYAQYIEYVPLTGLGAWFDYIFFTSIVLLLVILINYIPKLSLEWATTSSIKTLINCVLDKFIIIGILACVDVVIYLVGIDNVQPQNTIQNILTFSKFTLISYFLFLSINTFAVVKASYSSISLWNEAENLDPCTIIKEIRSKPTYGRVSKLVSMLRYLNLRHNTIEINQLGYGFAMNEYLAECSSKNILNLSSLRIKTHVYFIPLIFVLAYVFSTLKINFLLSFSFIIVLILLLLVLMFVTLKDIYRQIVHIDVKFSNKATIRFEGFELPFLDERNIISVIYSSILSPFIVNDVELKRSKIFSAKFYGTSIPTKQELLLPFWGNGKKFLIGSMQILLYIISLLESVFLQRVFYDEQFFTIQNFTNALTVGTPIVIILGTSGLYLLPHLVQLYTLITSTMQIVDEDSITKTKQLQIAKHHLVSTNIYAWLKMKCSLDELSLITKTISLEDYCQLRLNNINSITLIPLDNVFHKYDNTSYGQSLSQNEFVGALKFVGLKFAEQTCREVIKMKFQNRVKETDVLSKVEVMGVILFLLENDSTCNVELIIDFLKRHYGNPAKKNEIVLRDFLYRLTVTKVAQIHPIDFLNMLGLYGVFSSCCLKKKYLGDTNFLPDIALDYHGDTIDFNLWKNIIARSEHLLGKEVVDGKKMTFENTTKKDDKSESSSKGGDKNMEEMKWAEFLEDKSDEADNKKNPDEAFIQDIYRNNPQINFLSPSASSNSSIQENYNQYQDMQSTIAIHSLLFLSCPVIVIAKWIVMMALETGDKIENVSKSILQSFPVSLEQQFNAAPSESGDTVSGEAVKLSDSVAKKKKSTSKTDALQKSSSQKDINAMQDNMEELSTKFLTKVEKLEKEITTLKDATMEKEKILMEEITFLNSSNGFLGSVLFSCVYLSLPDFLNNTSNQFSLQIDTPFNSLQEKKLLTVNTLNAIPAFQQCEWKLKKRIQYQWLKVPTRDNFLTITIVMNGDRILGNAYVPLSLLFWSPANTTSSIKIKVIPKDETLKNQLLEIVYLASPLLFTSLDGNAAASDISLEGTDEANSGETNETPIKNTFLPNILEYNPIQKNSYNIDDGKVLEMQKKTLEQAASWKSLAQQIARKKQQVDYLPQPEGDEKEEWDKEKSPGGITEKDFDANFKIVKNYTEKDILHQSMRKQKFNYEEKLLFSHVKSALDPDDEKNVSEVQELDWLEFDEDKPSEGDGQLEQRNIDRELRRKFPEVPEITMINDMNQKLFEEKKKKSRPSGDPLESLDVLFGKKK